MFTGLVEKVGQWGGLRKRSGVMRAIIRHEPWSEPLAVGESVAVQGVCLTVMTAAARVFECDLLEETLNRTTLGRLEEGALVNLERAVKLGGRMGGHVVLGHVDGVGRLRRIGKKGDDRVLEVECGSDLMADIMPKGSVALDGISLTVVQALRSSFTVHVIPHTWESTSLKERVKGDVANIETDMIAKAVRASVERMFWGGSGISMDMLRRAGFDG